MRARRLGGVPPIVTVLITLSAIVAAGLVAWFIVTSTSSAAKQPLLEVTAAYATSNQLRINLRNIGTGTVSFSVGQITCTRGSQSASAPSAACNVGQLAPGESTVCTATMGNPVADGSSCTATITVSGVGQIIVAFKAVVP